MLKKATIAMQFNKLLGKGSSTDGPKASARSAAQDYGVNLCIIHFIHYQLVSIEALAVSANFAKLIWNYNQALILIDKLA